MMEEDKANPAYYNLPALASHRRKAAKAGSVMQMHRQDRHAYADAIEKAVLAKQREWYAKSIPTASPKYRPPTIARLLHYKNPIPMKGDPVWRWQNNNPYDQWEERQRIVYAHMIAEKINAR